MIGILQRAIVRHSRLLSWPELRCRRILRHLFEGRVETICLHRSIINLRISDWDLSAHQLQEDISIGKCGFSRCQHVFSCPCNPQSGSKECLLHRFLSHKLIPLYPFTPFNLATKANCCEVPMRGIQICACNWRGSMHRIEGVYALHRGDLGIS